MKTKEAIEIVENYRLRLKGDADIPKIDPETVIVALGVVIKEVKNLTLPQVSKSVTCHHPLPYRKSTGQYTPGYTCTLCGKFVDR